MSVVNGTVCGFNAGIHIGGGSRNKVANINLHDNIGPDNLPQFGDGIIIEHESSNNQIVRIVINHNGTCDGIGIYDPGSDRNSVVNNVVEITVSPAGHPPRGHHHQRNVRQRRINAIHGARVVNNGVQSSLASPRFSGSRNRPQGLSEAASSRMSVCQPPRGHSMMELLGASRELAEYLRPTGSG